MVRRTAALPGPNYSRPKRLDETRLAVSVVGEDGTEFGPFDFSRFPPAGDVRASLIVGFMQATGSDGRWRSQASASSGRSIIGTFLRHLETEHPTVRSIGSVTPEIWWSWRGHVEGNTKWPGQVNLLRALLFDTPGVPTLTVQAMRSRARKPKTRSYDAYTWSEFSRIKQVYTKAVADAERRISDNMNLLVAYWNGEEDAEKVSVKTQSRTWTRGEILQHLVTNGSPPKNLVLYPNHARVRAVFRLPDSVRVHHLLYPSPAEICALVALLVCERGYNPGVAFNLLVPTLVSGTNGTPVYVAHLDKPRRGPEHRYFSNNFAGDESRLVQRAIRMTQPVRYTLAQMGHETGQLLIARAVGGPQTRHESKLFITDWREPGYALRTLVNAYPIPADDETPLPITFQRLRLTEQVHSQRSRQNSDTVSEEIYRSRDPQTVAKVVPVILRGQREAVEHATALMQTRTVSSGELQNHHQAPEHLPAKLGINENQTEDLLAGRLDTATTACMDFNHSPFSGQSGPCTASFLMCLACTNAIGTPKHLPRLVALRSALRHISSVVSEARWRRDFAPHLARLEDLLLRLATPTEIADVASFTDETEQIIDALLRKDLDA